MQPLILKRMAGNIVLPMLRSQNVAIRNVNQIRQCDEMENAVIDCLKKIAMIQRTTAKTEELQKSINDELSQLVLDQQELDKTIALITAKIVNSKNQPRQTGTARSSKSGRVFKRLMNNIEPTTY